MYTLLSSGPVRPVCFAAANIPFHQDREVVVFEKGSKPLQKVKVSGGGRCNVTHACFEIPELIKRYPRGAIIPQKNHCIILGRNRRSSGSANVV